MTAERFNEFTEKQSSTSDTHMRPNMADPREMAILRQDRSSAGNQNVLENGFLRMDNPFNTSTTPGVGHDGMKEMEADFKQLMHLDRQILQSFERILAEVLPEILGNQSAGNPSDNSGGGPSTNPCDNSCGGTPSTNPSDNSGGGTPSTNPSDNGGGTGDSTGPQGNPGSTGAKLIVPMYFGSSGQGQDEWNQVINESPKGSILIANNGSGPGSFDPGLDSNITRASNAGLLPVGYIHCQAGTVPLSSIKNQVDQWYKNDPHLTGIFLDEASKNSNGTGGYSTDPNVESYYKQIGDYIHSKYGGKFILNGAGQPNPDLLGSVDVQTTWENNPSEYANLTGQMEGYQQNGAAPWQSNYSPDHFAAILNSTDPSQLQSAEQLALQRDNGYIFITNTEYTQLPSYLQQEINGLQS